MASAYREDQYDEKILGTHMTEKEFRVLMQDMNRTLVTYWPCQFCVWFGYLMAPFTFGLSFFFPNLCIRDAKVGLIAAIERQNRIKLKDKGLQLSYIQGISMSWLELSIIGEAEAIKAAPKAPQTAKESDVKQSTAPAKSDDIESQKKSEPTRPSTDNEQEVTQDEESEPLIKK